jgi:uncharacterized DUF497 family protein
MFTERTIQWDVDKDAYLRVTRGVSFAEVVELMRRDQVLAVVEHRNQERYPGQQIAVVAIDGYAYVIPFVEKGNHIFLKTIIPSRKATKQYLERG